MESAHSILKKKFDEAITSGELAPYHEHILKNTSSVSAENSHIRSI
jgi:hypothetical protein